MKFHAFVLACAFAASIGWGPAKAQSRDDRTISDRLDQILQRLESIEERITQLEIEVHASGPWRVDRQGFLRSMDGQEVGYWGMDMIPSTPIR